jgi:hypothetical protein
MSGIISRTAIGASIALFTAGANAALLDFTVPSSGFSVQTYTALPGSDPSGAISGGQIVGEAGFRDILLDVDGENLDIGLYDIVSASNPSIEDWNAVYFDANSSGKEGGLGVCQVLTATAQCDPGSDDNLTIAAGESLFMSFRKDDGFAVDSTFGEFIFRDDDHNLFNGTVQVSTTFGGAGLNIVVTGGSGDLSVLGASNALYFNNDGGAGSSGNYYISEANISAVPVPAAVWLFGSALGFLGWMRRKTVA